MSKTLHLKDEIYAICKKAGLEPSDVANLIVDPASITFEVYGRPKRMGLNGEPETAFVTHPWTREPE